jgi:hypothetical protein
MAEDYLKANYVAFATTPWHAHGVNAALLKIKEMEKEPLGWVCITPSHLKNEYFIKETNFIFDENMRFLKGESTDNMQCVSLENNNSNLYIITPLKVNFRWRKYFSELYPKRNIISIVVDEGLGTYLRSNLDWYYLQPTKKSILGYIIFVVKQIRNNKEQNGLIAKGQAFNWNLLKKDGRYYRKNDQIWEYYKKAIFNTLKESLDIKKQYENAVIINTQVSEKGKGYNDAELEVIRNLCTECKKRKIPVVVKPHPREENTEIYDLLGVYVEKDYVVSQESILAFSKVKPICIVGFTSTTLVTSTVMFDIPAFSLNKIVDLKRVEQDRLRDIKKFNRIFSKLIMIPTSIMELITEIEKLS